MIQTSRTLTNQ